MYTERTIDSFLNQAVNEKISFSTLLTLLNIASKPTCRMVRYLQPPPQDFGAFFTPLKDFKQFAYEEMLFREPENMTLNQLCEITYVVVKKIAKYHNKAEEASTRADLADRRAIQAEDQLEKVTRQLQMYAPHLFNYTLDD